MFEKKSCKNCKEKVKSSYSFCPNCGYKISQKTKNSGLLGNNDLENSPLESKPGFVSGISDRMLDKMLGSALRLIQKEMSKSMQDINKMPQPKMRLMINGKEISPQNQNAQKKENNTKFLPINFSKENLEKWKKLEKTEPESNLKRMNDKIQYEIKVPEVNSIKDISIIKLENSLEIKAVGEKKGYLKTIPIDLPLRKFSLLKGILTLELDTID